MWSQACAGQVSPAAGCPPRPEAPCQPIPRKLRTCRSVKAHRRKPTRTRWARSVLTGVGSLTRQEALDLRPQGLIEKVGDGATAHLVRRRSQERGHCPVRVGRPTVASHEPDAVERAVEDPAQPLHRHLADGRAHGQRVRRVCVHVLPTTPGAAPCARSLERRRRAHVRLRDGLGQSRLISRHSQQ
jgi:hypothetical protein